MKITEEASVLVMRDDGNNFVGEIRYITDKGTITFTHTGVDPDYRGKGLAELLVEAGIAKARQDGCKIGATCSYALKYLRTHKNELADVLASDV